MLAQSLLAILLFSTAWVWCLNPKRIRVRNMPEILLIQVVKFWNGLKVLICAWIQCIVFWCIFLAHLCIWHVICGRKSRKLKIRILIKQAHGTFICFMSTVQHCLNVHQYYFTQLRHNPLPVILYLFLLFCRRYVSFRRFVLRNVMCTCSKTEGIPMHHTSSHTSDWTFCQLFMYW